jgi:hypothetical protein
MPEGKERGFNTSVVEEPEHEEIVAVEPEAEILASPTAVDEPTVQEEESVVATTSATTISTKRSAAAHMEARRQAAAAKRTSVRNASNLITAEHFSYVRRDLIRIGILAAIMFIAIVVCYFTLGHSI